MASQYSNFLFLRYPKAIREVQKDPTLSANNSQHCSMLHVTSVCTPCCILLDDVVAQSLKPVKLQTDTTLLANNSQHCWMLHVASVRTPCCMLLGEV